MSRPVLSLVTISAILAGGLGVAMVTEPAPRAAGREAERQSVPVARSGGTCPDPMTDNDATTWVSMAAPGALGRAPRGRAADDGAGAARLEPLGGAGSPLARLSAPSATTLAARPGSGPLAAVASGALAPGFAAAQLTRVSAGDLRGLAGTACPAAGTEFWFVGSGAVIGQRGRLYLSNPESAPAVVDVTLFGPDGPIEAPGGRGVAVAAGDQKVLLLDALAPDTSRFGVHVEVRQGRVSAALRDQQVRGLTTLGTDWVPPAAVPARRLVIPGAVGGPGERRLQVLAPGDSDAIVRVKVIGADGTFAPAGLDVTQSPAGSVSDLDLSPHLRERGAAVELTSDVPITAGLLVRVGGEAGAAAELAYTAAAAPLTRDQPGVVAQVRADKPLETNLLLAAPAGDAAVDLVPIPPATGRPVRVDVPGGTHRVVDLATVSTVGMFSVSVVPRAGSGPVAAASEVSEGGQSGPLLTLAPVWPGRFAVGVPVVSPDLSTGLGTGR